MTYVNYVLELCHTGRHFVLQSSALASAKIRLICHLRLFTGQCVDHDDNNRIICATLHTVFTFIMIQSNPNLKIITIEKASVS
jgi:hypothetical protein